MNLNGIISKNKKGLFKYAAEFAVDILCPKRCIVCNGFIPVASKISICTDCRQIVSKFGKAVVDDRVAYDEVVSALEYGNCIRDAIMRYKFEGKRYLSHTFAWAVYQKLKDRKFMDETDIICPVPIHPLRARDYNQAALIADDISAHTGIECIHDLLLKVKNLRALSTMTYIDRRLFVRNSMIMNTKYNISGKSILIIDDIFTSGATIAECARILKIYGAEKVYATTACYAEFDKKAEEDDNEGGTANAYANLFTD